MIRQMTALALLLLLVGCEKKRTVPRPAASAELAQPGAALDPQMAQAVAAVASASATPNQPLQQDGPPPKGIFPPGVANSKIKRGAEPSLELASPGRAPQRQLVAQPAPGSKQALQATIGFRGGPRAPQLTIDTKLAAAVLEPAQKLPPSDQAEAEPALVPGSVRVRVEVLSAQPSASLAGVPRELSVAISKMAGSVLQYQVAGNGGGHHLQVSLGKDALDLANIVHRLGEALVGMRVPLPAQALGPGGLWMSKRRHHYAGMDMLHYQLVKLEQVEPGNFLMEVNGRHYAADTSIDLGAAGQGLNPALEQLRIQSRAQLTQLPVPGLVVSAGRWEANLQASMFDTGNPQKRMSLQEGVMIVFATENAAANPALGKPTPGHPRQVPGVP